MIKYPSGLQDEEELKFHMLGKLGHLYMKKLSFVTAATYIPLQNPNLILETKV